MRSQPSSSTSTRKSHLRVSDAERELVALRLHDALAEGRLDLGELDDRINAVYAARTYAELEPRQMTR